MSETLSRRAVLQNALGVFSPLPILTERSFWVLRLLYPRKLLVKPLGNARLHCVSHDRSWIVEGRSVVSVQADIFTTTDEVQVAGPGGGPVDFVLEIPDVLHRNYRGVLRLSSDGQVLRPVVAMDGETAVSSIVGAELPVSSAWFSALAAQAVASRSVLLSKGGHYRHGFTDFCDTTHCQFLRSPAAVGSLVQQAVCETAGTVLVQDGRAVFALYSGACGGRTEGGWRDGVRYSRVHCEPCFRESRTRRGHGWGMCQDGAIALAQKGWNWHKILALYYPDVVASSTLA